MKLNVKALNINYARAISNKGCLMFDTCDNTSWVDFNSENEWKEYHTETISNVFACMYYKGYEPNSFDEVIEFLNTLKPNQTLAEIYICN